MVPVYRITDHFESLRVLGISLNFGCSQKEGTKTSSNKLIVHTQPTIQRKRTSFDVPSSILSTSKSGASMHAQQENILVLTGVPV